MNRTVKLGDQHEQEVMQQAARKATSSPKGESAAAICEALTASGVLPDGYSCRPAALIIYSDPDPRSNHKVLDERETDCVPENRCNELRKEGLVENHTCHAAVEIIHHNGGKNEQCFYIECQCENLYNGRTCCTKSINGVKSRHHPALKAVGEWLNNHYG